MPDLKTTTKAHFDDRKSAVLARLGVKEQVATDAELEKQVIDGLKKDSDSAPDEPTWQGSPDSAMVKDALADLTTRLEAKLEGVGNAISAANAKAANPGKKPTRRRVGTPPRKSAGSGANRSRKRPIRKSRGRKGP